MEEFGGEGSNCCFAKDVFSVFAKVLVAGVVGDLYRRTDRFHNISVDNHELTFVVVHYVVFFGELKDDSLV